MVYTALQEPGEGPLALQSQVRVRFMTPEARPTPEWDLGQPLDAVFSRMWKKSLFP